MLPEKLKEAIDLLHNSKSKKRESGAKRLRKLESIESGPFLLEALEKEMKDIRTWSTQYHLILALGHSKFEKALPYLKKIATEEFDATILYSSIGDSIFRLSIISETLEDTLKTIYSYDNFMITDGAFQALGQLKLIPSDEVIKEIIKICSDPKGAEIVQGSPNDQTGLRLWIVSASAGWKDELKIDFLNDCEKIKDQQLQLAVANAKKGKYIKWSPY